MRFDRKKKTGKKSMKVANIAVFILLILVFVAVVGYIAFWSYMKINEEAPEESLEEGENPYLEFTQSDCFNILFIFTDDTENSKQAEGFTMIRIDPLKEKLFVASYPKEIVVGEKENYLKDVFKQEGREKSRALLEGYTNSKIHHAVEISFKGVEDIMKHYASGIVFDIPEDMEYRGDGISVRIKAGSQTLSASQCADVLRYPSSAWSGGSSQRTQVYSDIILTFLNKYFNETRMEVADQDFEKVIDFVGTDINIASFYEMKPSLEYIAKEEDFEKIKVDIAGEYTGDGEGTKFSIFKDYLKEYKDIFGDIEGNIENNNKGKSENSKENSD